MFHYNKYAFSHNHNQEFIFKNIILFKTKQSYSVFLNKIISIILEQYTRKHNYIKKLYLFKNMTRNHKYIQNKKTYSAF